MVSKATSTQTASGSTAIPRLEPSDWIVLWLSLDGLNRVRGKTRLMKQLFVVGREVVPQAFESFGFFPHRFGPYSQVLENALGNLQERAFISVVSHTDSPENVLTTDVKRYDYILTDLGQERARTVLSGMPDDVVQSLVRHKRVLSKMGYYGLLSYVYGNYPEFTTMSELELA